MGTQEGAASASQGQRPQGEINPASTLALDSSFQSCEELNSSCLGCPISGILLWQPWPTSKTPLGPAVGYPGHPPIPVALHDFSGSLDCCLLAGIQVNFLA